MPIYNIPQFNAEITNPTITINEDSIVIHASRNEISLSVTLETQDSKLYGLILKDIPVSNLNYEGSSNLMTRAIEGLSQYEVVD